MASSFAISEVKALVRQPQREHAQQLLDKLANAVLPILTQRQFRVRRLLEFFPKNGSLLGMNVNCGAKIYVRLRPKGNPNVFLPYEALLETLLHELTHMVHGPHNQAFYKYLDELKAEMESLMMRGLVGEEGVKFGEAGEGQRLGGQHTGVSIRVAAVLAAKRREQYHRLLGGETSWRLGTASSTGASNDALDAQALRQKVLEAAERRRRDNENCRNVLREGATPDVLGIESSDEENNPEARHGPPAAADIVVLADEPPPPRAPSNNLIILIDDDDHEGTSASSSDLRVRRPHGQGDRDRKRQRQQDVAEIIDLT